MKQRHNNGRVLPPASKALQAPLPSIFIPPKALEVAGLMQRLTAPTMAWSIAPLRMCSCAASMTMMLVEQAVSYAQLGPEKYQKPYNSVKENLLKLFIKVTTLRIMTIYYYKTRLVQHFISL